MPEWKSHIKGISTLQDRYRDGQTTFEYMRDHVVKILRVRLASYLREDRLEYNEELVEILDELSEVDDNAYYDFVKNALYDWCDYNLVWIDPTN